VSCRWFAYGPDDVISTPLSLTLIQTGLTFQVTAYPGCPEKEAVKQVSVCNYVSDLYRFQDIASYLSKAANFSHPRGIWHPSQGWPHWILSRPTASENKSPWATMRNCLRDVLPFDRTQTWNTQTDGQTQGHSIYRASSASIVSTTHTTTVLRPFFQDHPGEPVPEEKFRTLWCKGRLTEADTCASIVSVVW